jgi:hypothetical protein
MGKCYSDIWSKARTRCARYTGGWHAGGKRESRQVRQEEKEDKDKEDEEEEKEKYYGQNKFKGWGKIIKQN